MEGWRITAGGTPCPWREREREGWCRYSEVDRLVCLGKLIASISSTKEKVSSTVIDRRVWTWRLGRTEKIQMDLEGERWPGKMGTSRQTKGLLRLMLQCHVSSTRKEEELGLGDEEPGGGHSGLQLLRQFSPTSYLPIKTWKYQSTVQGEPIHGAGGQGGQTVIPQALPEPYMPRTRQEPEVVKGEPCSLGLDGLSS